MIFIECMLSLCTDISLHQERDVQLEKGTTKLFHEVYVNRKRQEEIRYQKYDAEAEDEILNRTLLIHYFVIVWNDKSKFCQSIFISLEAEIYCNRYVCTFFFYVFLFVCPCVHQETPRPLKIERWNKNQINPNLCGSRPPSIDLDLKTTRSRSNFHLSGKI